MAYPEPHNLNDIYGPGAENKAVNNLLRPMYVADKEREAIPQ